MKQTRALYARANTIIHKFSAASLSTKLLLFKAYCTPLYGCQLWCSMFQYSYRKLNVAYNDAFRQLLQQPRWCSASQLSLCLIIYLHFLLICVSSCIHCIACSEMFSYKLHWTVIRVLFHYYFIDGVTCCFNLLLRVLVYSLFLV